VRKSTLEKAAGPQPTNVHTFLSPRYHSCNPSIRGFFADLAKCREIKENKVWSVVQKSWTRRVLKEKGKINFTRAENF
jgi:hypothetical protein